MSFKQKMDGHVKTGSIEPVIGGHKKDGQTYATIGEGNISIGRRMMPTGLNRYLNNMHYMDADYDIHPIRGYFNPGRDNDEINKGIPRDENGNIDLKGVGDGFIEAILDPFGMSIKRLSEEEVEQIEETAKAKDKRKAANDNSCNSGNGICYEEIFGQELAQDSEKRLSFNEFADEISNKLGLDKQDKAAQDYLRETYQAYLDNGAIEVSKFGMHAHEAGMLIEQFKQENPNLSDGIKLAIDTTGATIGVVADGVVYVFKPLKGVWEVYRDFVNENLVPKKWNEWLVEQESKLRSEGTKWHGGLTSKQKLALDTAVETVDFGTNLVLAGAATKIGTKVAFDVSYKIGASGLAAEKILYDSKNGLVYKVANDNFDLSTFEGGLHNGHAIEKHVGKSAEWLKDRLDDVQSKGGFIKGSTSFPDLATANKYTKETLLKNKDAIESWLSNTQSPRTQGFLAEFNDVIGYGYNKNNQFFNSINKVNVVLKKTEDGFIVYTSHPIVDKVK